MSERPLVVAGQKVGITKETVDALYQRSLENPFNSTRKMMSVVVDSSSAGAGVACRRSCPFGVP
jgi:magnesium-transporting ATPase (P-type)